MVKYIVFNEQMEAFYVVLENLSAEVAERLADESVVDISTSASYVNVDVNMDAKCDPKKINVAKIMDVAKNTMDGYNVYDRLLAALLMQAIIDRSKKIATVENPPVVVPETPANPVAQVDASATATPAPAEEKKKPVEVPTVVPTAVPTVVPTVKKPVDVPTVVPTMKKPVEVPTVVPAAKKSAAVSTVKKPNEVPIDEKQKPDVVPVDNEHPGVVREDRDDHESGVDEKKGGSWKQIPIKKHVSGFTKLSDKKRSIFNGIEEITDRHGKKIKQYTMEESIMDFKNRYFGSPCNVPECKCLTPHTIGDQNMCWLAMYVASEDPKHICVSKSCYDGSCHGYKGNKYSASVHSKYHLEQKNRAAGVLSYQCAFNRPGHRIISFEEKLKYEENHIRLTLINCIDLNSYRFEISREDDNVVYRVFPKKQ